MTNPAYEATNSDVEKSLSEEHERPSKILFIIAARIARREHLRPLHALSELNQKTIGTRALNQMIEQVEESLLRESGKLVRVAEKYEEVKRKNAELARRIAELESAPNGMMQLSNELAEMKRKQKPAYDVTAFGQFSAWGMGGEMRTAITQFIFDDSPDNRKGEMVPKFMLQGIINSLQEHCDKMGDKSMIEIMVVAGGTDEGGE